MRNIVLYGALSAIFALMVFFGSRAYHQAIVYGDVTKELVSYQDAGQQASLQFEKFAKSLLGEWYDDELTATMEQLKQKQQTSMQDAKQNTLYFMVLLVCLLLSYPLLSLRVFTFVGALGALLTLIFGLVTPILMVTIHKEVEYLGDIVLSFESKGVMGSIVKLFENGQAIVAVVILLFSVLLPLLKVFSLLFISVFMQNEVAHKILHFFKILGKWSMADVFVVAIFLVYLTSNNADTSRAEVEVGLYFFLAYVLVSMAISFSADKMMSSQSKE